MKRTVILVGGVLTLCCLLPYVFKLPAVVRVSNIGHDILIRRLAAEPGSGAIAVVDLDEASLREYGQWPWPRYLLADLTAAMIAAGARVIAFDVVFAERDRTSPDVWREHIRVHRDVEVDLRAMPAELRDFDRLFADAMRKGKCILGASMLPESDNVDPDAVVDHAYMGRYAVRSAVEDAIELADALPAAGGMILSHPALTHAAPSAFFDAQTDDDNIVRRNPLLKTLGTERVYPALALEAVRQYAGARQVIIDCDNVGLIGLGIGDLYVPTDRAGQVVVNYRRLRTNQISGFESSFPLVSAAQVLQGVAGDALEGRIVFVGTSAQGLRDIKATPLTANFSGVEVHATIADNILVGDVLRSPSWIVVMDVALIVLVGIGLSFLIAYLRSWVVFLLTILLVIALLAGSYLLLVNLRLAYAPTWIVLSVLLIYTVLTMLRYWGEERSRRRVRVMFGAMVSAEVLEHLEENPDCFSLQGRRAEATMFFSDLAGFTTISEALAAGQLSDLLNRYLSPMADIVMEHNGYVDKYEGDAIMAEWGVPNPVEDHATQACLAAIEQQRCLAELRPILKEDFGHELYVRMGINSGVVTAGNMGTARRMQYTVMGDAVNLAARLEPVNKDYGTSMIIGQATYKAAAKSIEVRLLDRIVVAGKTEAVEIYELIGRAGDVSQVRLDGGALYERALQMHWDRDWVGALRCLDQLAQLDHVDGAAANLRSRVEGYQVNPPRSNWGGEVVRHVKD